MKSQKQENANHETQSKQEIGDKFVYQWKGKSGVGYLGKDRVYYYPHAIKDKGLTSSKKWWDYANSEWFLCESHSSKYEVFQQIIWDAKDITIYSVEQWFWLMCLAEEIIDKDAMYDEEYDYENEIDWHNENKDVPF